MKHEAGKCHTDEFIGLLLVLVLNHSIEVQLWLSLRSLYILRINLSTFLFLISDNYKLKFMAYGFYHREDIKDTYLL